MIFSIILQAKTYTESVPVIAYFTLAAALIAAGTSIYSTLTSSRTSREVARLAAESGRDLKARDFTNDYYKKIIDRRLLAYESLEKAVSELSRRRIIDIELHSGKITHHEIYNFFTSDEEFEKFNSILIELIDKSLWFSSSIKKELVIFQNRIAEIGNAFQVYIGQDIGAIKLRIEGIKYDEEINTCRKKLISLVKTELIDIQDIENFFGSLKEPVK